MDGIVVAKIKEKPNGAKILPIIFLTVKGDTMSMGMRNTTAEDYVAKPFDINDPKKRLEEILN